MGADKFVDSAWLESGLTAIANAIRAKAGVSNKLAFPDGFVAAVAGITTGESGGSGGSGTNTRAAGLYATGTETLHITWDSLLDQGAITVTDGYVLTFVAPTLAGDLVLPGSITLIASRAFDHCTRLTSIALPDGVTGIGESAFAGCSGLTSMVIPGLVTTISSWAFDSCTSLASVVIPKSVMGIEKGAFTSCSGLKIVYYAGTAVEFSNISIGAYNSPLTSATFVYNFTG